MSQSASGAQEKVKAVRDFQRIKTVPKEKFPPKVAADRHMNLKCLGDIYFGIYFSLIFSSEL